MNVVREDPGRKGLLFAGTEREIYVSFDDGDHWQSLRLNMPATSMRDLIVKDDDVVVATHGRGFWILDDITPLRQLDRTADRRRRRRPCSSPRPPTRVRWNMYTDTPLPPDEPAGENPPDGAIINYAFGRDAAGPVTLEILDARGQGHPPLRQHRSRRKARSGDRSRARSTGTGRPRSSRPTAGAHRFALGHALPAARRRRRTGRRPADLGDSLQHRPDAELHLGGAGDVHHPADRGGEEPTLSR